VSDWRHGERRALIQPLCRVAKSGATHKSMATSWATESVGAVVTSALIGAFFERLNYDVVVPEQPARLGAPRPRLSRF
jgi:hypothetical protein